jgi:hypothetical protein
MSGWQGMHGDRKTSMPVDGSGAGKLLTLNCILQLKNPLEKPAEVQGSHGPAPQTAPCPDTRSLMGRPGPRVRLAMFSLGSGEVGSHR